MEEVTNLTKGTQKNLKIQLQNFILPLKTTYLYPSFLIDINNKKILINNSSIKVIIDKRKSLTFPYNIRLYGIPNRNVNIEVINKPFLGTFINKVVNPVINIMKVTINNPFPKTISNSVKLNKVKVYFTNVYLAYKFVVIRVIKEEKINIINEIPIGKIDFPINNDLIEIGVESMDSKVWYTFSPAIEYPVNDIGIRGIPIIMIITAILKSIVL